MFCRKTMLPFGSHNPTIVSMSCIRSFVGDEMALVLGCCAIERRPRRSRGDQGARPLFSQHRRRWSSNPSRKCSSERPTQGTVCGTMRSTCGADAGCLAINYQSLFTTTPPHTRYPFALGIIHVCVYTKGSPVGATQAHVGRSGVVIPSGTCLPHTA